MTWTHNEPARGALKALPFVLLAAALLACDPPQMGVFNHLEFEDQTANAILFDRTIHPIALGATIQIKVREDGEPAALTSVRSLKPNVLSVTKTLADEFTLHAGSAGTSQISVTTPTTNDALDLRVEPVAASLLSAEPLIALDSNYFSQSFAVEPQAAVPFLIERFDANGTQLTGFGVAPITATPASALFQQPDSDYFHVVAPATVGATVVLHAGTDFNIEVVDPAQVASLDLVVLTGPPAKLEPEPAIFSVKGQAMYALLSARLADGRFVFGPCGDFNLTQPAGAAAVTVGLDTPNEPYSAWDNPIRELGLSFAKTGATSFTLQCLGQTRTYTVTVTPATSP